MPRDSITNITSTNSKIPILRPVFRHSWPSLLVHIRSELFPIATAARIMSSHSYYATQGDALIDNDGQVIIRYSDLQSSPSSHNSNDVCLADFSDSPGFSQKLRDVTNLNELASSPIPHIYQDDLSFTNEKSASLGCEPAISESDSIETDCNYNNRDGPAVDDPVTEEPLVTSPYFSKPMVERAKRLLHPVNNIVRTAAPASKLPSIEKSQVPWSSSPDFHSRETMESLKRARTSASSFTLASKLASFESVSNSLSKRVGAIRSISTNVPASSPAATAQEVQSSGHKPTAAAPLAKIFLSKEQNQVLEMVVKGEHSVFFTGAAGTGKSVLLQRIIADLNTKHGRRHVGVTASTGLAALNIGGTTLHSFTGIGLGKESANDLVKKIRRNRRKLTKWKAIKVLIIDEISMIDGDLFDKLDSVAKVLRRNNNPFGGIQLIITGDFFQLPPVSIETELKFAFEAESWNEVVPHTIVLQQVFRQKDNTFSQMLNEMRRGELKKETISTFEKLSRTPNLPKEMTPTELYPKRIHVERSNDRMLKSLKGQKFTFQADDFYDSPEAEKMYNLENMIAVTELSLKKGAQVMMIKNIDETLVNGSTGIVIGFMSESSFGLIDGAPPEVVDEILESQSQVQSGPDRKIVSIQEAPEEDSDDDFSVFALPSSEKEIEKDPLKMNWKRKKERIQQLSHNSRKIGQVWPVVRFFQVDGTTRDVLCQPETWSFENDLGKSNARRSQVPLILAWALSIHKSQGQTLKWVKVDLSHTFEKGQAYVAISRAVSMAGLQVIGFQPRKVMVHPKVVKFYDELSNVFDVKKSMLEPEKVLEAEQETDANAKQLSPQVFEIDKVVNKEIVDVQPNDEVKKSMDYVDMMFSNVPFIEISKLDPVVPSASSTIGTRRSFPDDGNEIPLEELKDAIWQPPNRRIRSRRFRTRSPSPEFGIPSSSKTERHSHIFM